MPAVVPLSQGVEGARPPTETHEHLKPVWSRMAPGYPLDPAVLLREELLLASVFAELLPVPLEGMHMLEQGCCWRGRADAAGCRP